MFLLNIDFTLPLDNPVLKFLVLLIIILAAPLLLNKIKVPHLIGLIIAGALIGPNGFNVLPRDSNIVVTGTTGLLYIMFLAGLEIDLAEFKKNKWKSVAFGMYTFAIPLAFGVILGRYVLNFTWLTSFIFASLFSSHTLISYPLLSKLGLVKNRAVNVAVGGTMITDTLALLILAVVVGITQGEVNAAFWIKLSISFLVFSVVILGGVPILGRWFFKNESDKVSQYIFVLVVIYLSALFAELAGVEGIIGAFFAGLALNRLIPHTSALMNRIDFVGNAIFIPFFLISVGMLIDFRVFLKGYETILVMVIMLVSGILSKYIAAYFTQKSLGYTKAEGNLIFGLSTSHAAATLAVVLVGYNIIIGENELGEPIRLLNENVLNGSIVLILVSCTISSFVTQKNGEKLQRLDPDQNIKDISSTSEKILLALNYEKTIEPLTNLALMMKSSKNKDKLFAVNIISNDNSESAEKNAEKLIETTEKLGASADVKINGRARYDSDVQQGISNAIKENKITDLVLGIDPNREFTPSFTYNLYNGYLRNPFTNVYVYREVQPISTIKRHLVVIPENAHEEPGFFHALAKVWNIGKNAGSAIVFYASEKTIDILLKIKNKVNIESTFTVFKDWRKLDQIIGSMKDDDAIILMLADRGRPSHNLYMGNVPNELSGTLNNKNSLLVFPFSGEIHSGHAYRNINNPDEFAEISNIIRRIFN